MRAAYFDCFAGVSGDMMISALIDLGADFESLTRQLSSLGLKGYELTSKQVTRNGIAAIKFDVEVDQREQPARKLADVCKIIGESALSDRVKSLSVLVFERLAEAEARVHGATPDEVHFHEVGSVDSIIDTVGAMIGFELLGIEKFFCSPLRLGGGFVETQHGRLPVPAPATAELIKHVPVYSGDLEGEFVTPTGAAIVTTLCEEFGSMPLMKFDRVGYGAGTRDPKGFPNALRMFVGELEERANRSAILSSSQQVETLTIIETNIDDMNPQAYGFVMERAFELGALDVFVVPAQMKKDRPGVLLTVLCNPATADAIIDMLLIQTTTLGVRYYEAKRRTLERAIETVDTEYGSVRIKVARDGARTLHFQPEYDDCARLAVESGAPLLEVQAAANAAYRNKLKAERATGKPNG